MWGIFVESKLLLRFNAKGRKMAVDKELRVVKEIICNPIAKIIGNLLTPTQITIIGFFIGLLCPIFLIYDNYLHFGTLFWLINRLLDGIDGVVARNTNRQTDFGGYIDIICDFIIYAIIPIALAVAHPSEVLYIVLAILQGTFFVNAASLMFLSSILEKRSQGSSSNRLFF